jgi:hypothetical protein
MVTPLVYALAIFILLAAVKFVLRLLSLSRGIEHLLTTGATKTARLGARLRLEDPLVLGQALGGIGIVVMIFVVLHFLPFIKAFGTKSISSFPAEWYLPLQPSQNSTHLYRFTFTMLTVGFGLGAARIWRLRATQPVRRGGAGVAIVLVMFVVSLVMCQFPYRIVWKNEMPRLDVAGERCFAIGKADDRLLIHCPDRVPPRNRIVDRNASDIHDTGLVQNIFTPPETPHE